MKVFVVGYPKTGTKTMAAALTQLGYNVLDYDSTFYHLRKEWMKIITEGGTKDDFYRMYKDVDASCDNPACTFWEDILEAFPNVKMILMQRESQDEWVSSMQNQIEMLDSNYTLKVYAWFSPTARAFFLYLNHLMRVTLSGPMSGKFYAAVNHVSPTVMKMRYRNHNAAVLLNAPKEQLLVYNLSDGWEPLCKFLEKPVPDIPFPHKNKGGTVYDEYLEFSPAFVQMRRETMIYLSLYLAFLAVVIFGFYNLVFKSV